MTITVTSLGPNSADFTYTAGETAATLITSIGSWVTSHGWTSHDAANNVYKALCFDGVTYKYAQLFAPSTTSLFIRVYETWNATTHVGTNEAVYYMAAGSTPTAATSITTFSISSTAGGKITMLSSIRYMLMYTYDNTTFVQTTPNGCIEWTTDYVDVSGVPFGWMYCSQILGQYTWYNGANGYYNMISPVRILGLTGAAASNYTAIQAYTYNCVLPITNASINGAIGIGLAQLLPTVNNTVSGLPQSYTLNVVKHASISSTNNNSQYLLPQRTLGRLYGIKVIAGLIQTWISGDTCSIAIDSNGFQVLTGGTNTNHHIAMVAPTNATLTTMRVAISV